MESGTHVGKMVLTTVRVKALSATGLGRQARGNRPPSDGKQFVEMADDQVG